MNEGTLTLLITKLGKEKLVSLTDKSYCLKVAFGDTYKEFNAEDTTLAHECAQTNAKISAGSDSNTTVHIQAYLNNTEADFNIHEVGLLLLGKNNISTLIGIYRTEKILAKKTAHVDFFLDITLQLHDYNLEKAVINLPEYQPIFEMSPASNKKFGTVRLATEESIRIGEENEFVLSTKNLATEETLKQKKSGFVLTTNHLDMILSRGAGWSSLIDDQSPHEATNLETFFIGLGYDPYQKVICSIYGLYYASKYVILSGKYDEKENKLETIKFENENIPRFSKVSPTFSFAGKASINFYFLSGKLVGNIKCYQGTFKNNSISLTSSDVSKISDGYLFTYGNKIGVISKENIVFICTDNLKNIEVSSLPPPQQKIPSIVHTIQDKIYCLEGSNITIYTLKSPNASTSFSAFTPMVTSNIDLKNEKKYASTVLGNYIYIFDSDNYYNSATGSAEFYRYNILDNQWQSFTFPSDKRVNFKPELSSAITVENAIYLFIAGKDQERKLKISILKYTPA